MGAGGTSSHYPKRHLGTCVLAAENHHVRIFWVLYWISRAYHGVPFDGLFLFGEPLALTGSGAFGYPHVSAAS